jgi:hypothetical protein
MNFHHHIYQPCRQSRHALGSEVSRNQLIRLNHGLEHREEPVASANQLPPCPSKIGTHRGGAGDRALGQKEKPPEGSFSHFSPDDRGSGGHQSQL